MISSPHCWAPGWMSGPRLWCGNATCEPWPNTVRADGCWAPMSSATRTSAKQRAPRCSPWHRCTRRGRRCRLSRQVPSLRCHRSTVTTERINARVGAYFRHITKVVGKELAEPLLDRASITVSAGLHIAQSHLVAVLIDDADALAQWRGWAVQCSSDPREMHTAPTLILSTMPGGGIYLFRTPATVGPDKTPDARFEPLPEMQLSVGTCRITSGDITVPIPPTRMFGQPVMRLGPCRMLPSWLESMLRAHGIAEDPAA